MAFCAATLVCITPALAQDGTPSALGGQGDAAVRLDTITVQGQKDAATGPVGGYVARNSATGTKTNTPAIETPQSVTTVSREQIEAQGAQTVAEALRYEPGVVAETRGGNRFDSVYIRGFGGFGGNANYVQYWDNLRLPKGVNYAVPSIDPYLLERVDILRGPASVLYGQGNPGGLINLVSKRPTATPQNEIMTRFGNNGHLEGAFDLSGPVDKEGKFLYRLIALGQRADTDVDFNHDQRMLIAPMLTWRPDGDTSVTVQGLYDRDPKSYQTNWLPAQGTLQGNPNGRIPYSFFSGHPDYNSYDRTQSAIGYQAEHRFNDTWTVRQNFRYIHLDTDFKALSVPPGGSPWSAPALCGGIANLCLARSTTHYIEHLDSATLDNQAEANFNTGPLRHKALAGLDYQWLSADATYGNGATSYVNYLNPVYGPVSAPALTSRQDSTRKQLGLYAQDQITFDRWHALIGVREDWSDVSTDTTTLATRAVSTAKTSDSATTWKAGLLYEFDNGIAPYASFSTSFEPSIGTGFGGVPFKPTTARQYEAGIKYKPSFFDALFTASVFDLTQQNVLTNDLLHTSTNTVLTGCSAAACQMQTGEVRSRGFELGGKATLLPGLNLIAAYTYADVEVTKSTVVTGGIAVKGKVPVGVPDQTASLWADYTVQNGAMRGWGLGAGVRYIASSYGDQINSDAMRVPSYTLVDAAIHYDFSGLGPAFKGLSAQLNVANIFDKRYVSACASANQCFYGNGRTILATLAYRW